MVKALLYVISKPFNLFYFKLKWRRQNKHNFTTAGNKFSLNKIIVGNYTYGSILAYDYGEENSKLVIGNLCSIALNVRFILGGNHYTTGYMNYPISPMITKEGIGSYSKGPIIIGHDCWLGFETLILSGITLGNGCVVAAGSVVTKSFPSYSIIGGNPAKLIKRRFSAEIIEIMEKNEWIYQKDSEWYRKFEHSLILNPTLENLNKLLEIDA